ncbi:hypothetical protein MRX96_054236 [Rhipicephalus microplus]
MNLRKSGTEEQFGEREQLLQDVSDLMGEVDYAPQNRAAEGKRHGAIEKTKWQEATATNLLLAIYEDDLSEPPHGGDGTAGDKTTTSPAGEEPAAAPEATRPLDCSSF